MKSDQKVLVLLFYFNFMFFQFSTISGYVYVVRDIQYYIIIRVHSAFSLVVSCVLLKYTRTDDVN